MEELIDFEIEITYGQKELSLIVDADYETEIENDSYSDEFGHVPMPSYEHICEIEINRIYDLDTVKDYTKELKKEVSDDAKELLEKKKIATIEKKRITCPCRETSKRNSNISQQAQNGKSNKKRHSNKKEY